MRLGIDIGGTCTDFALHHNANLYELKVPTTPDDLERGVLLGLSQLANRLQRDTRQLLGEIESIVHGTTVATNALLTGNTARTAFFTTAGHRDILLLREAGRMGLSAFDHTLTNPKPFVPRSLTYEVPERIDATGRIIKPLDEGAIANLLESLAGQPPAAFAICLLWSIVNPRHELRLAELIRVRFPDAYLSLSHVVNPCIREYRRASSTSIDASLKPLVSAYAKRLQETLNGKGFRGGLWFATSEGTVSPIDDTSPIHLVRSGPALGPVAASYYLDTLAVSTSVDDDTTPPASPQPSSSNAILIDVGGTTLDVALIRNGRASTTRETWLGTPYLGHMTGFPAVDVRSIGAGGGSIARVIAGRLIEVGPDSAGAKPGPACYLQGGTQATVTDAAVVLGYVDATTFIDEPPEKIAAAARSAIEKNIAEPLKLTCEQAADAVFRIFVEDAASSIEDLTVADGIDPRQMTLVATGGAGGLLAGSLARRLGATHVLFPPTASVNCAAGGVLADIKRNFIVTRPVSSWDCDKNTVLEIIEELTERCTDFGKHFTSGAARMRLEFFVEARYQGQSWEIVVPFDTTAAGDMRQLTQLFHTTHQQLYHYQDPSSSIDFLSWKVTATLESDTTLLRRVKTNGRHEQTYRAVYFSNGPPTRTAVLKDEQLRTRGETLGPVIVECDLTTIVADHNTRVSITDADCILLQIDRAT